MADKKNNTKDEGGLSGAMGWLPRKTGELKGFLSEVKVELRKVTWPGKPEVYNTTIVVLITTFFFGFYLYGLDVAFSWVLQPVLSLRQ